jgi:hypothetical protein
MKPKTFLLSLLLLPYLIWVLAAIFSFFLIWILIYTIGLIPGVGDILVALGGFAGVYVGGFIIAGIPYTLFVIVFFFWSKNKSAQKTYSVLFYSPIFLALITSVGITIVGLAFRLVAGKIPPLEDWRNFGLISLLGSALCLVYGYIFVGIGMAGYKLFDHLKLFKKETETQEDIEVNAAPSNDKIEGNVN